VRKLRKKRKAAPISDTAFILYIIANASYLVS
jgi:hypothetical protein